MRMASLLFGWACVTIALLEKRALTNGLIDPAPFKVSVIFEAEAVGLILAAQLLLKHNAATFPATIFMDNQAVIHSSSKPSARPGHYLLICFRKLIRHVLDWRDINDSEIPLNWITGHADILGNELADKEARRCNGRILSFFILSYQCIYLI